MNQWTSVEGAPAPLGVSWVEEDKAYNFALYSKHATAVVLLLYAEREPANPIHIGIVETRRRQRSRDRGFRARRLPGSIPRFRDHDIHCEPGRDRLSEGPWSQYRGNCKPHDGVQSGRDVEERPVNA